MLDNILIHKSNYNWKLSIPILRYVLGTCLIMTVTTLLNYELYYLTSILSLSFLAPGAKPMSFNKGFGFIITLVLLTGLSFIFSVFFIDYPLVFMPMLCLAILWIYYSHKFPVVIKLFALMSVLIIPLLTLESNVLGGFISISLVFNTLMAILLTQLMFFIFPWCEADEDFSKSQPNTVVQSDNTRFKYALNILIIIFPLLLLFFMFKLSGGLLILIFVAILSISPALSNAKVGSAMIAANIFGGLFAILAYKLLVIVPMLPFMIILTMAVGLFFGKNLFSKNKFAPIFGTGFSSFLLILGSVTSSDDQAGSAVWTRVIQISIAVIYVVVAFGILNQLQKLKSQKTT